ncbi:MAG: M15 family metallopeptidase [Nannocystaceae bacterium]
MNASTASASTSASTDPATTGAVTTGASTTGASTPGASKTGASTTSATTSIATTTPPPPLGEPSEWTELVTLDPTIRLDIRYATADNFVGEPLYACGRCFLRPAAAAALARAHAALRSRGYGGLLLFDCYRPRPVQQKMWDRVPDEDAVAPPWRGSNHNRGIAVDLSLVDADGAELDLGTPYDQFSARSAHSFKRLPAEVLRRRADLRGALEAEGFAAYNLEWWHYSFTAGRWPLADATWECP